MSQTPFVIEWYRPDRMPVLWRIWGFGSIFVCGGSIGCGWAFTRFTRAGQDDVALAIMLFGLVSVAGGMIYAIRRTWRVLDEETCFVLRSDGLSYQRPGRDAPVIAWERIDGVHLEGEDDLLVRTDDGRPPLRVEGPFAGTPTAELCKRVNETQRKALMGLIRRRG